MSLLWWPADEKAVLIDLSQVNQLESDSSLTLSSPLSSTHHSPPERHRGVALLNRLSLTYFPALLLTGELTQSIRGKMVFYSAPFKWIEALWKWRRSRTLLLYMVLEQMPYRICWRWRGGGVNSSKFIGLLCNYHYKNIWLFSNRKDYRSIYTCRKTPTG